MSELLPAVKRFLAAQPLKMFIGGRWVEAAAGGRLPAVDPGTGGLLTEFATGDGEDVSRAVEAARSAFRHSGWAAKPERERAAILRRYAELVEREAEPLVQIESLDVGRPAKEIAAVDIPLVVNTLRYYAEVAQKTPRRVRLGLRGLDARTYRAPYGVCGVIVPWNFPMVNIIWGVAPATAAGNAVVLNRPRTPRFPRSISPGWRRRPAFRRGLSTWFPA